MKLHFVWMIALLALGCASSGPNFDSDMVQGQIEAGLPKGWVLGGPAQKSFVVGLDREVVAQGSQSATLYSTDAGRSEMATLKQAVRARDFAGERVRFRARVRNSGVEQWAGLWLRADSDREQTIAFDNMANRRIKGSGDWATYDIVLDIPKAARVLHLGILMIGRGQVWIDDASLEVVDESTGVTAPRRDGFPLRAGERTINPSPRNLDFEQG